jgi:general stress protein 26
MTDPADVELRLWDEIEKHNTGMLMLTEPRLQHAQPMTAFVDREGRTVWFFTRTDTDLASAIGAGGQAMFVYQRDDLQACISGTVALSHDEARMERYWNSVVAAWYPEGKADPRLTLIRFEPEDAEVWTAKGGPVKFALEIAKANVTGREPDIGDRSHLHFH